MPNTLPLPNAGSVLSAIVPEKEEGAKASPVAAPEALLPPPAENIVVDENDLFTKGKISKFFPYQGYGFVLDKKGREIFFSLAEMNFVGEKGKTSLKAGHPVGYDVSWTSNGLHVKKMKVY